MNICEYGCNTEARFILKNGKHCCSTYFTKCSAYRNKRSKAVKESFELGLLIPPVFKRSVPWNKNLTKKTDIRVLSHSNTLHDGFKSGRLKPSNLGRKHTDDEKMNLSKKKTEFLKLHPDQVPYKLNHSSRVSYPEKYFKLLFSLEHIPLLYHKQVGLYELDFYNEEMMKYVEIDGESHYSDKKTIEIDKRRAVFLDENGWQGKRIRWSLYKRATKEEKKQIILEIREFINGSVAENLRHSALNGNQAGELPVTSTILHK
jgi:very-short-patch-repair endonuclease